MQFSISATAFLPLAFAGFDQIVTDFDKVMANQSSTDRTLPQHQMNLISSYGCWCFFENAHGPGKGKPVDEIDGFCRTLHDNYQCAIMDGEAQSTDCTPWAIGYNSAFGGGIPPEMTMEGIVAECNRQNPSDTCMVWACKAEGWFVQEYLLYALSGGTINLANRHENGFNHDEECPVLPLGIYSPIACCKDYPQRFPYKTRNGDRGCCGGKTYNALTMDCCSDGKARVSC